MATEGIGEVAHLLAPGFGHDARVDGVGTFAPVACAVVALEAHGDLAQAVARRPAHRAGVGVHVGAAAVFPQTRIGYVMQGKGLFAQGFQAGEGVRVARVLQAAARLPRRTGPMPR
ncbi:hypothetical protein G6F32_016630 [Rhizopus arrhizus]|nr:hypothetical protein G6F32_016630 [Rhizopus arrhizus]